MLRVATLLVALSATLQLVSAQGNFTTCCNVDPNSVEQDTRLSWCRAQTNTCPLLCQNGQTSNNTCDPNTLSYTCTCQTGNTPNISSYAQTLPSLECDSWVAECTAAHPNDLTGQTFCQSFMCGKKNATAIGAGASGSSSAGSASSTSSSSMSSTATGTSSSATASKSSSAMKLGKEYGTAGIALGLLGLFGLAL